MTEPRRRKRFQIHLSTAIVLMFVAGALMWANTHKDVVLTHTPMVLPKFDATAHVEKTEFGWPFAGTVQEIVVVRNKQQLVIDTQLMNSTTSSLAWIAIHVDIAAVLLGSGIRLLEHLAGTPIVLGNPTAIAGFGVTHLRYPIRTT